MDLFTLALAKGFAKSYADKLLCGITSVRIEDTTIYFTITETGEEVSVSLPVPKDGVSIVAVDIDDNNYLVCTFSDGTTSKSSKPIEFEIEGTSGEDNKIESISVNGKEVVPDTNKNVDIEIPTFDNLLSTTLSVTVSGPYGTVLRDEVKAYTYLYEPMEEFSDEL